MTKEQFTKLLSAIQALGYSEGDTVQIMYDQDLISWK